MFDGKAFGQEMVDVVKSHIGNVMAPIVARLDAIEKQVAAIPAPKQVPDLALVERVFKSDVATQVAELRAEFKSAIPDVERIVAPIISGAIKDYAATVIQPKEVNPQDVAAIVAKDIGPQLVDLRRAVEAIPPAPALPDIPAMIDEAVSKSVAALPVAKDGTSVTLADVAPIITVAVSELAETIPDQIRAAVEKLPTPAAGKDGVDGKDADPEVIKTFVAEAVKTAVAAIPVPVAGKDGAPGKDGERGLDGVPGKDGQSVTISDVAPTIEAAVAALPRPQDGKSVTADECRPLIEEAVQRAVSALPVAKDGSNGKDGRDGLDVKDLLVVENGDLVATFSDGRSKNLGPFRGKDGAPGKNGEDGAPGKDGIDGVGFDDMDFEIRDNGCYLTFTKGDLVKEWHTPIPIDQGVWSLGKSYRKGNVVTYDGSSWISQDDANTDKPGTSKAWRLAVKKGRDRNDPVKIDG